MKNLIYLKNKNSNVISSTFMAMLLAFSFTSCEFVDDLPEANSKVDLTPPSANFTAEQDNDVFTSYNFSNTSISATTYAWDFGDGNTSTDVDAQNDYPGEGTYIVTLTASDALGVTSTFSQTIEVIEPLEPVSIVPTILEPDFEDFSLPDGSGDGRDSWRSSLGGVIQITSSPVNQGEQAAKFPSGGDRVAYQGALEVSPNTDYILTYYYTLKTANAGSLTVSVVPDGTYPDVAAAQASAIESFEGSDQTSASDYVRVDLPFNSGANEFVALLITNQGEEARVDTISIVLK